MAADFLNSQMWNSEAKLGFVQGPLICSTSHSEIQLFTHWVTATVHTLFRNHVYV